MWFKNNRESRIVLLGIGVILSLLTITHLRSLRLKSNEYNAVHSQWNIPDNPLAQQPSQSSWHFDAARDAFNYGLSDEQCDVR